MFVCYCNRVICVYISGVLDLIHETPISLPKAASRFGVSLQTLHNWASGRTGRRRLSTVTMGRRRFTTLEELQRFSASDEEMKSTLTRSTDPQHEAAVKRLEEHHGIRFSKEAITDGHKTKNPNHKKQTVPDV